MLSKLVTNKYIRKLLLLGCNVLSFINTIIRKREDYIFFYESVEGSFHDNSEAMYHYLLHRDSEIDYKYIVCVSDINANKHLISNNTRVVNQFAGIFYYLRSKYCFYSYSSLRIKPSSDQIVVNQGHGTPLKVIGKWVKDKYNHNEDMNMFTYTLAGSELFRPVIKGAFDCALNQVLICGHTRTDYFYEADEVLSLFVNKRYKKTVLWMPTFRISKTNRHKDLGENFDYHKSETFLPLIESADQLNTLNEWLKEKDILLTIKYHTLSNTKSLEYSNIMMLRDDDLNKKKVQLYRFVKEFDALLTDYSSIYFDFLLLNRPIGFIIDDFDLYEKNRGFTIENPLSYMPGNHIRKVDELYAYFENLLRGTDEYKEERCRINGLVNSFRDGNNCKRLADLIELK